MKSLGVMISAAALSLAFTGSAGAVDLWETSYGDGMMYDQNITITENGQERHLVLMNGELIRSICSECTIAVEGGKTVQASAADVVELRGSSISVRHSVADYAASPTAHQEAQLQSPEKSMTPGSEDESAQKIGTPNNDADADPFDGPEGAN